MTVWVRRYNYNADRTRKSNWKDNMFEVTMKVTATEIQIVNLVT